MTTRRLAKAAEAIRETVSTTILFELRDPRVKNVTVLSAEAAPDLRTAKVYVSVMGTPKQQSLCLHGLESARGFIQAKLADRLQTRYTPVLKFVLDPGVKRSIEASRLLREVIPPVSDDNDDDEEWEDEEDDGDFADAAADSLESVSEDCEHENHATNDPTTEMTETDDQHEQPKA
ncbi:MAG: 30S ribosome-binding factor RbfA [Planctomycetaceae bacterium]|nr:30S ribosome-binding factor RbfA [Planctomycetaceae bacterium]